MKQKWTKRFIDMAELVGSWSKDPSTRVGAVIVDNKQRIVSTGFNGFPRGVQDRVDVGRETKLARTIHAEANAILFAGRQLDGCTIFVTQPPCSNCAALIIQAGIKRVVTAKPDDAFMERWNASIMESWQMFREAGIEVFMSHGDAIWKPKLLDNTKK
jgi:dCMP deaminase